MTLSQIASWAIAHPEALAALVVAARVLYALASRLAAPYPRARAVVEGIAALGPDVLRAVQQLGSALLGRPLPSLDVRAPDDDRAQLRAQIEARDLRILDLERQVIAASGGSPTRTPSIALVSPSKVPPGPVDHSGERGSAELRGVALLLAVSLVLAGLGAVLSGCPRLPPVSGCTPLAYRCTEDGRPEVCSSTQRWEPIGDESCDAGGSVCVVDRTAHCAPHSITATDGGSDVR